MTTLHSPEVLCAGMLADVKIAAEHMRNTTRPRLDAILNPSSREICIRDMFFRSLCWMETLARLDRTQDFQAVATCTRFQLENCVDLVLVSSDREGELAAKMEAWSISARYKAAASAVKFYEDRDEQIPDVQMPLHHYYVKN
jgi:hypothetical protein